MCGMWRCAPWSVLPSEAREPALQEGDGDDERGEDERAGRADAVVLVAERRVVQVDQRRPDGGGGVPGLAGVEQVEELIERLERGDEDEHEDRGVGGPQQREGDGPESLPPARAIQGRGLVQVWRDGLEPGQEE